MAVPYSLFDFINIRLTLHRNGIYFASQEEAAHRLRGAKIEIRMEKDGQIKSNARMRIPVIHNSTSEYPVSSIFVLLRPPLLFKFAGVAQHINDENKTTGIRLFHSVLSPDR